MPILIKYTLAILTLNTRESDMKKLFVLLALALASTLTAAVLMSTQINGTKTYCHYSDGSVLVIDGMGTCPATI